MCALLFYVIYTFFKVGIVMCSSLMGFHKVILENGN